MKVKNAYKKAAFTLYELVIVMALSALVVGLVTSYIIFANKFAARTQASSERIEQFTALREEIDMWFSYADRNEYDIVITNHSTTVNGTSVPEGCVVVVVDNTGVPVGYIQLYSDNDSGKLVRFVDVLETRYVLPGKTISCPYIKDIVFYKCEGENDTETNTETNTEGAAALRFTIKTNVNTGLYACEFIC